MYKNFKNWLISQRYSVYSYTDDELHQIYSNEYLDYLDYIYNLQKSRASYVA